MDVWVFLKYNKMNNAITVSFLKEIEVLFQCDGRGDPSADAIAERILWRTKMWIVVNVVEEH